jgi:putative CocE/NonD family hydrolase
VAEVTFRALLMLVLAGLTACGPKPSEPARNTVRMPMRDGVVLATDLFFPGSGSPPYPVVLIRTPYNKEWIAGYGQYYARAGFAVALQDVRGRWASEGEWVPFVHEGEDGYDAIEWLGTQEWSTGKVGMVGGSYSGTAQFAAALLKPPHLVTIVPNVAAAMPDANIPRDGGALALGWALRWTDIVENARTGRDMQAKVQHSLQTDWSGPLSGLPVVDLDRSVVGGEVSYFRDWVHHVPGDDYWDSVSFLEGLEEVDIPVFLQSGWFDPGTRGTRLAFEHLIRGGNRHVRMILGPWAHGDRGSRDLNGIDMGAAAERDLMNEYRKWLEFFLMTDAHDVEDEPAVELYVMGTNRWINGPQYPPAAVEVRPLYLAGAPSQHGGGMLSWDRPPQNDAADVFTYDPSRPTPSFHAAIKRGALAAYRARVDTGRDVLVYESATFDEALDIVGPIEMKLYASSSAKDTDWTGTLYGLTPTGEARVLGLTFGILRARYRDSPTSPSLMEPGTVYPFTIDLGHTAVTLAAGERLRLEIASAAFPEFSRNLNTGGNNELETEWVTAQQRVYRSADRASHLLLPILGKR